MSNKQQNQQQETKLVASLPTQEKEMTEQTQDIAHSEVHSNVVPMVPQTEADAMVSMIERVILNPEISMDRVEKMIELKERFDDREAEKAFNQALAKALGEIPTIIKTGEVDFTNKSGQRTNYTHETYDDIVKVVKPILSKYGLAFRYKMEESQGGIKVTCVLSHEDGFSEKISKSGQRDVSGNKNALQGDASTQQYLMRYTLKAALGISVGADTDGNAPDHFEPISNNQMKTIFNLIDNTETDIAKFCQFMNIENIKAMPVSKFGKAEKLLKAKLEQKNG